MDVTLSGIIMLVSPVHPLNAEVSMEVTPSRISAYLTVLFDFSISVGTELPPKTTFERFAMLPNISVLDDEL